MIGVGSFVEGLAQGEAAEILKIKQLGAMVYVRFEGAKSGRTSERLLSQAEFDALIEVANGDTFSFDGDPEKFKLFAEAKCIRTAYQFDPLFALNCSVVDALPHQVEAVYGCMLPQPDSIRFLLADDTGAGKTIMTGLLLKELMLRGRAKRVLIVAPGGLTKQWQEDEMKARFNLDFTLVNRGTLLAQPAAFRDLDMVVTSVDFVSREDVRASLMEASWDLAVFDEAHKLSAYESGERKRESLRYSAAKEIAARTKHLLLLTATPHRGRADTFKLLMQLLDEQTFATAELTSKRVCEVPEHGANKFFIRRLKEDMKDWEGNALYKQRFTKTVAYALTPGEKQLYDHVTEYLTQRRREADASRNVHVALALQVMQRRLASSIYAIMKTLERRCGALEELAREAGRTSQFFAKARRQASDFDDLRNLDDFDELGDEERGEFESELLDPKRFRYFTTAQDLEAVRREALETRKLFEEAKALYQGEAEEQKYMELKELLRREGVVDGEKLVIFTEHKDTLTYLEGRLKNNGYKTAVIHGGMAIDERREAQALFASDQAQILICTEAAGEGINLQFCRLLINWDIPWNPNRLEQRMGRIHRYGQKRDVLVCNMVAGNTREGKVLQRLFEKLDLIREHLGDDRVYDVIQDVLKGVSLEQIIAAVFEGKEGALEDFLDSSKEALGERFRDSIREKEAAAPHTEVDYKAAKRLRQESRERCLQPIYIRKFFEKAFTFLGGAYEQLDSDIYQVTRLPALLEARLKRRHAPGAAGLPLFFFDKRQYLENKRSKAEYAKAHYITPGNALFDSLLETVEEEFKLEARKGTVLVSPEGRTEALAFLTRVTVQDSGGCKRAGKFALVLEENKGEAGSSFSEAPSSILLNYNKPEEPAKRPAVPRTVTQDDAALWAFEHISKPLTGATRQKLEADAQARKLYAEEAFKTRLKELEDEIIELQDKQIHARSEAEEQKFAQKEEALHGQKRELLQKREAFQKAMQGPDLVDTLPEIFGCAYLVPLSALEFKERAGMSRDDEVEAIAMTVAVEHERSQGRAPQDVSKENWGYDIKSVGATEFDTRYIEVKGRARTDGVMLSENEWNRLHQLGELAWLYIVTACKSEPKLQIVNDPARVLRPEVRSKGVQYFVPLEEWQRHCEP